LPEQAAILEEGVGLAIDIVEDLDAAGVEHGVI
jgi:hypothetical protein